MMPRNFFHTRRTWAGICGLWLALLNTPVLAVENQQLRQAVDRFMAGYTEKLKSHLGKQSRVEYDVGTLDGRQNVPVCAVPPRVETRDSAQPNARLTLQISCPQANGWSIYLPVDLTLYRPVVIAVKPLTHGSTVTADDVRLSEANVSQINGQYLSSLDEAIGKDVKRAITSGSPIIQQQLVPPLMVRRGDAVTVSATSNIVAVKVAGIALTDGRLGEQIRIKNQSSTRIVNARIIGPGQVEVPM